MMKLLLVMISCAVIARAQNPTFCLFVGRRDCTAEKTAQVCATNGQTYRNKCEYAKAYCKNNNLHLANDGPCPNAATTPITTAATKPGTAATTLKSSQAPVVTMLTTTSQPINGSVIAFDIFCLDLSYVVCPVGGTRVCGSDGKFYDNACEFDKERCFHRQLHSRDSGCV